MKSSPGLVENQGFLVLEVIERCPRRIYSSFSVSGPRIRSLNVSARSLTVSLRISWTISGVLFGPAIPITSNKSINKKGRGFKQVGWGIEGDTDDRPSYPPWTLSHYRQGAIHVFIIFIIKAVHVLSIVTRLDLKNKQNSLLIFFLWFLWWKFASSGKWSRALHEVRTWDVEDLEGAWFCFQAQQVE